MRPNVLPPDKVTKETKYKNRRFPVKLFVMVVGLACVLLILVTLILNATVKTDYQQGMAQIARQIVDFQRTNRRLPRQDEFLTFDLQSRSLSLDKIHYENHYILEDSPPTTVLAYSPSPPLRLAGPRHLVIYLNGEVAWCSAEELLQAVTRRNQHYNKQILTPVY